MRRNPESPWNPMVPTDITPAQFEELVLAWLSKAGADTGLVLEARHLGTVSGAGGDYKIDVLIDFTAFGGASFVVLVECKHKGRPVEREDVMVIQSKLQDVRAQKAMLFSTSGFQSGALEFAAEYRIATVTVVDGTWLYETRCRFAPAQPPPCVQFDRFAGIRLTTANARISSHSIQMDHLDALQEWFQEA